MKPSQSASPPGAGSGFDNTPQSFRAERGAAPRPGDCSELVSSPNCTGVLTTVLLGSEHPEALCRSRVLVLFAVIFSPVHRRASRPIAQCATRQENTTSEQAPLPPEHSPDNADEWFLGRGLQRGRHDHHDGNSTYLPAYLTSPISCGPRRDLPPSPAQPVTCVTPRKSFTVWPICNPSHRAGVTVAECCLTP